MDANQIDQEVNDKAKLGLTLKAGPSDKPSRGLESQMTDFLAGHWLADKLTSSWSLYKMGGLHNRHRGLIVKP